jgi:alpha/beta superfamily hydrolase
VSAENDKFLNLSATSINTAIAGLLKRAEAEDPATLAETFVDVNALFARLSSRDSQIMFGRRGTGKTHALKYLTETLRKKGDTVVFLDLRLLGSSGGIYTDSGISVEEAGTRLLVDVLQATYDELLEQALTGSAAGGKDGDLLLTRLERLGEALGGVEIVGEAEERNLASADSCQSSELGIEAPRLTAFARANEGRRLAAERELVMRGVARHRVHFSSVAGAMKKLIPSLPGGRLWLIMDEWSHVAMDLQPLLADLIRHCLLPIPGVTVKFAAIETRTNFRLDRSDGSYIGIEVGADVSADIDLDEFMVFTTGGANATEFFAQLFQRHIQAASTGGLNFSSPEEFIGDAFAGRLAFQELVRAAEGVPRDGINVLSKAALLASNDRITLRHVRDAARGWYLSDKQATLNARPADRDLLHWIIDQVIDERRVRGFLLRQGSESHHINWLYDARLIHLIRKSIAAKDQAGVRFDAYAVDYGCYVDLFATRGSGPKGLLRVDDEDNLEVPEDDLELIRGAVLDLDEFVEESDSAASVRRDQSEVTLRGHAREGSLIVESPLDLSAKGNPSDWCVLVEAPQGVVVVPLGKRPIRIGSSSNDHVRIHRESVVPRHAVIELSDGEPVIKADKGRVYLNDLRVTIQPLRHREIVSLGDTELLVFAPGELGSQLVG